MSADNMWAVLELDDNLGYLARHQVSFYPEYYTQEELLEAFSGAKYFYDRKIALDYASQEMIKEDICEYGVCTFSMSDAGYKSYDDLPPLEKAQRILMDKQGGFSQEELQKLAKEL